MKQKQCPNGHFYDASKYNQCPACAGNVSSVPFNANANGWVADNIGPTMPLNQPQAGMVDPNIGKTMPLNQDSLGGFVPEELGKTEPVTPFKNEDEDADEVRPVCGWLVCIKGKKKGRSFECFTGVNSVGRDEDNDVVLDFDPAISKKNMNLSYDDVDNEFNVWFGQGKNIIKHNGKTLGSQTVLRDGDILRIGKSEFLFRALCNDSFRWLSDEEE